MRVKNGVSGGCEGVGEWGAEAGGWKEEGREDGPGRGEACGEDMVLVLCERADALPRVDPELW